jgi:non-canonical purine NTP pyrophosphatase (RdgB/HAM1 family)
MKNLYFVTGNHIKVEIREEGSDIIKIAADKARAGYSRIKRPVISDDSAFIIPSLNNYPGARVKRELEHKGLEHFKELANDNEGKLDGYFSMAVTYFDGKDEPKSFVSEVHGYLISEERGNRKTKSELGKIFVLEGHTKTLAEMTKEEADKHATSDRWERLRNHLLERY